MIDKIKGNPALKRFIIGLITSHKNPRPRLWVKWFVNPFVHKRGRGAIIRRRRSRIDVFPWRRFEVGRDALLADVTTVNSGAGDVLIGDGARIGIGSVVIGPVRLGDRVGLGQHVFISGFNHGYNDGTRDSNEQPLDLKEVVIGNESHIGANSVVVAGVHIGERVQVGAGSVVTKDIPSFSVAVGNPARVIKRYDDALGVWVKTRNPQEGIRRQDDNDNSCNSGATEP
uniref:acyltransferase n=1 Tax=Alistipes indistinctus TaxID=626932 RepID=UPI004027C3F5